MRRVLARLAGPAQRPQTYSVLIGTRAIVNLAPSTRSAGERHLQPSFRHVDRWRSHRRAAPRKDETAAEANGTIADPIRRP
ncbi:MAG: hypothetical protein DI569_03690 [Sphingopyxis macrogoltabida]|uniref:Uncharacterized protein n=1 Tax=Sphingopyxis macrogoltabida TaxID=33050 RepID=A0A2W5N0J6_SPHMC|nr:MAG: hypothetical protein DI569_03690 [Sphingopyxis macrogoltabida]